ncbi:saccharopine dehydrogenase NADP-binding domain-containing protein [Pseudomonas aeruginosa]
MGFSINPPQRIVFVGLGTTAQSFLPLLSKVHDLSTLEIYAIDPKTPPLIEYFANSFGLKFINSAIDQINYRDILVPILGEGTVLINLSTDVSSLALIELCRSAGALYLDTCIEPWKGGYDDPTIPLHKRTNYHLREQMLSLKKRLGSGVTALVAHGANPGLVSHFVKRALLDLAEEILGDCKKPSNKEQWAILSQRLGVKVIHVAEYDSQISQKSRERGEFVNTWSVHGFISESQQPAELGWGSHERSLPTDASMHTDGCGAAIYIEKPGASVRVKTWTPFNGPSLGYLVTHHEAISIADFLTLRTADETYRPTVHYAYRPSDEAILSVHEWFGNDCMTPEKTKVLRPGDILSGSDYLGVLLMGHEKSSYWYGSILSIEKAKELATLNTATTLQVAAGVLSGYLWILSHPSAGIIEAEDMDHEVALSYISQYLGELKGVYSDWNPTKNNPGTFSAIDSDSPWLFSNFVL